MHWARCKKELAKSIQPFWIKTLTANFDNFIKARTSHSNIDITKKIRVYAYAQLIPIHFVNSHRNLIIGNFLECSYVSIAHGYVLKMGPELRKHNN